MHDVYWVMIWRRFYSHPLGRCALWVVIAFCLVGIYAPFLAASKPFVVKYAGSWYFPLFRYLFFPGYYTKRLDIFFNLLIFSFPIVVALFFLCRRRIKYFWWGLAAIIILQLGTVAYWAYYPVGNPAFDKSLSESRSTALASHLLPSWDFDLKHMNDYARLNAVLQYRERKRQQQVIESYVPNHANLPTLWNENRLIIEEDIKRLEEAMSQAKKGSWQYMESKASLAYIRDKQQWLEEQQPLISFDIMPFMRPFHWEDDAGGSQNLNRLLPFWEMTRINRKDLVAALIFGVRISLVVGALAIFIALLIGIPIGAYAGYYGGKFDIVVSRVLEVWEAMPTFFMLLMVVAMLQNKSIFLVIGVIGIFGWTSFSRYIRGEFFKQRNLSYIEACRSMGFSDNYIIFSHILPNALPPILTLIPFAIMGAITSEAGLSFLGLGEEGSCSWGVLMDEGRASFPAESYLLWPPAILLTLLLVSIALVGDSLRDALDPKMHRI